MRITIIFGGIGGERGISINSARACFEILKGLCTINLHYLSKDGDFFQVNESHIYFNTPEDFDFLLKNKIENYWEKLDCDYVIPMIHGVFGEDGQIQQHLEKRNIPFLFSGSIACKNMFLKNKACDLLWQNGFYKWNSYLFDGNWNKLQKFCENNKNIIIKPNDGGSSIDVNIFQNFSEAKNFLENRLNEFWIVEELHKGQEFSIVVTEKNVQLPIHIDYEGNILSYRDKYFPDSDVRFINPANFEELVIHQIRYYCKKIFQIFGAKDVIRIDGFLLEGGQIIYTDINPIPSMEFNGIFFQSFFQNNHEVFLEILNNSLEKYQLQPLQMKNVENKEIIPVLMGGNSSEKHVSLISGASVCLKLIKSQKYTPQAYILQDDYVYKVPFYLIFRHSLEDVLSIIRQEKNINPILKNFGFKMLQTEKISLEQFLENKKFVFLALHGGIGEDGTLQEILENKKIAFNGEGSEISRLCMNKLAIIEKIEALNLVSIAKMGRMVIEYPYEINYELVEQYIQKHKNIIIKPLSDGCSTGITKISNMQQFSVYIQSILDNKKYLILDNQKIILSKQNLLLEPFIEANHFVQDNWLEMTIGYFNKKTFCPSLTIAKKSVLSAEEKFQSGTGINVTPPPMLSQENILYIQETINLILKKLNFKFYGRIDLMFNLKTNKIVVFDVNTLPALTFSTVLFHQLLYEKISPEVFIENLIDLCYLRFK